MATDRLSRELVVAGPPRQIPPPPPPPVTALATNTRPNFTMPPPGGSTPPPLTGAQRAGQAAGRVAGNAAVGLREVAVATNDALPGRPTTSLGRLARQAGPAAAGAGLYYADKALRGAQPEPEAFVPPALKPGDIPGPAPGQVAPAPVRQRSPLGIGPNDETTRNVGNMINAVPGMRMLTGVVPRVAATVPALAAAPQVVAETIRGAQLAQDLDREPAAPAAPTASTFNDRRTSAPDPKDFTAGLNRVPNGLPADLTDGRIYRTTDENGRTVYSGRNVREGAQIVNGMGDPVATRGGVSVVPNSNVAVLERMRQNGQISDAAQAAVGPSITGFGGSTPGERVGGNGGFGLLDTSRGARLRRVEQQLDMERFGRRADTNGNLRSRDAAIGGLEKEAAELGSEITRANTAAGNDATALGVEELRGRNALATETVRGQFGLAEAGARARGTAANNGLSRQAVAAAFQEAGGNRALAAQILERNGFVKEAGDLAGLTTGEQSQATAADAQFKARRENALALFRNEFIKDDGKGGQAFDEVGAERAVTLLNSLTNGRYENLPTAEQARERMKASVLARVYGKIEADDPVGWQALNPFRAPAERNEQMTELKGAGVNRLGWFGGAVTLGAERGETILRMPDGRNINVGSLTKQERQLLEEMAASGTSR